jgi:signal transduction histidine kinase
VAEVSQSGPSGGDQFQVSVSSLSLGTLYEAIIDFSSQETHHAFWQAVCKNARWIFPMRRMCILLDTADGLVCEGYFESGKYQQPAEAMVTPAGGPLAKALLSAPTRWVTDTDELFSDKDDPLSKWFFEKTWPTVFTTAVAIKKKCIGVIVFCMPEVESNDRTMLTALGTVYALHAAMAHTLIRYTQERFETLQKLHDKNEELEGTLRELRDAQRKLVEADKMAALGGLVAGIAHEINTPVGIGVTAASHLHQRLGELVGLYKTGKMKRSDLNKFLETADQSSGLVLSNLNRASEIIRSFKQVAVDQSSEEQRSFALGEYLHEILVSLRPRIKKTKHDVTVECDEKITLDTFPGALAQIVTNLVMNSLIHAYDKGDEGKIRVVVTQKPGATVLVYSDDGKGISEANLAKVFEPFFTTRRTDGGSGLGMHIVYNLVTQRLGGQIDIDSKLGEGTTFTLTLPETGA